MLAHCPSQRLLPKLFATVTGDRDGRLRQSAAEYLLAALEWWQPAEYERQLEGLERALLAAAQDAQAETRAVGRCLYCAYARAWPAQAHALLARLGRDKAALQERLVQAAQEYAPGGRACKLRMGASGSTHHRMCICITGTRVGPGGGMSCFMCPLFVC